MATLRQPRRVTDPGPALLLPEFQLTMATFGQRGQSAQHILVYREGCPGSTTVQDAPPGTHDVTATIPTLEPGDSGDRHVSS
jgi:hypothetical protein